MLSHRVVFCLFFEIFHIPVPPMCGSALRILSPWPSWLRCLVPMTGPWSPRMRSPKPSGLIRLWISCYAAALSSRTCPQLDWTFQCASSVWPENHKTSAAFMRALRQKKEVLLGSTLHARFANTLAQKAIVDVVNRAMLRNKGKAHRPMQRERSRMIGVHVKSKRRQSNGQ